jgi:NAD-dependent dihydropyrimidine dehydrogenase PreA subunit
MGQLRYIRNVVTLSLEETKCIGCGMCLQVCPQAVLARNGGRRVTVRDRDACMECGACQKNCPTGALSVQAGVGCAAAVINGMLGRDSTACCCVIEPSEHGKGQRSSCC